MAKYKPKTLDQIQDPASKVVHGAMRLVGLGLNQYVYSCGNPACDQMIIFPYTGRRPVRCDKCGEDIDWGGIFTRQIRICPQCKQQYSNESKFCSMCPTKEPLKIVEVEK